MRRRRVHSLHLRAQLMKLKSQISLSSCWVRHKHSHAFYLSSSCDPPEGKSETYSKGQKKEGGKTLKGKNIRDQPTAAC